MIYFIRDEETQFVKIGFTAGDGEGRLSDLQTGCPGKLALLLQIEGSKQEETAWHERFGRLRERGEWFRPEAELLLAITEAKVSQLQAENARLQAMLDAERESVGVARGQLGSLSAYLHGDPLPQGSGGFCSADESPLESENARLQAKLQAERDSRRSLVVALGNIKRMLEGPATVPVQRAVIYGC